MLRFSGFELDSERAELRRPDGETIRLRPKTLEILRLLAGEAGRVLSKQQLMEAVWPNVHVGEDSLFQCIREIRTALGDDKRQHGPSDLRSRLSVPGRSGGGLRPCGVARARSIRPEGGHRDDRCAGKTGFRLEPAPRRGGLFRGGRHPVHDARRVDVEFPA